MSENVSTQQDSSEGFDLNKLYTLPKCPKYLVNLFGQQNVCEFEELLLSDPCVEADELLLSGELPESEWREYVTLIPEFHDVRRELRRIADNFMETLKCKLPRYVEQTFVVRTRVSGLPISKTEIKVTEEDIPEVRMKKGVFQLFNAFSDFVSNYELDGSSYRVARLSEFISLLSSKLTMEIMAIFASDSDDNFWRLDGFARGLKFIDDEYMKQHNGASFIAKVVLSELSHVISVLKNNMDALEKLFEVIPQDLQENENELNEHVKLLFEDVAKLSEFRQVGSAQTNFDNSAILFTGDNLTKWIEQKRPVLIAIVTVSLDTSDGVPIPVQVLIDEKNESFGMYSNRNKASFDLYLDRSNGELYFAATHMSLHEIDGVISDTNLPKGFYPKLKYIIYSALYDHLKNKDPDLEELLRIKEGEMPVVENVVKSTHAFVAYKAPECVSEDEEPEGASVLKKLPLGDYNGHKVYRALCKLLGEPIRKYKGSHIVWRGEGNGITYPVPIHFNKHVTPTILRTALMKWGIDADEFLEAY